MSKAEDKALKEYPYKEGYDVELPYPSTYDENKDQREAYIKGYHQAEKDFKEELSKLFREFMMDCINDSTDTHILHFVEVFNNKIKTIGNE